VLDTQRLLIPDAPALAVVQQPRVPVQMVLLDVRARQLRVWRGTLPQPQRHSPRWAERWAERLEYAARWRLGPVLGAKVLADPDTGCLIMHGTGPGQAVVVSSPAQ